MNNLNIEKIIATEVDEKQRLEMLPKYFGRIMMQVEAHIFGFMGRLCDGYNGGYWSFYELSNGGFYMSPAIEGKLSLVWPDNYFEGELSADAAGIVACLFAYSHAACATHDEQVIQMYKYLREYIHFHPEANLILRTID